MIAVKGQKHPRAITSGNKKQITVLACASAASYTLPPLVIFVRKGLVEDLTVDEIPGTAYGLSDKGWMEGEIFDEWFTHHFLKHAPASRPLLLLLDGHSTHYTPDFITKAAHEKVIVFCLPPNTTHLTQPLDKGVFGPFKIYWNEECQTYWNEECQTYMRKNPCKVINQYNFMTIFSKVWCRAMTIPNILSAFRTTGIYPINRLVLKTTDATITTNQMSLTERTGLKFIPLYSPATLRSQSCIQQEISSDATTAVNLINATTDELEKSIDHQHGSDYQQKKENGLFNAQFTEEEHDKFSRRLEEGYDITTDLWLKMNMAEDDIIYG